MEKIMYEIKIKNEENTISLFQPIYGDNDQQIIISNDQINVLIKWLIEAQRYVDERTN